MKAKKSKVWQERLGRQAEEAQAKQAKRKDNIDGRIKAKMDNRKARREKKLLRAGFEGRNGTAIANGLDGEIAASSGLEVDGIRTDGGAADLQIQISTGSEIQGHGAIFDEQALNGDALCGVDIHRGGIFDTIKDGDIAFAGDGECTGSGSARQPGCGSDKANGDRVIGLEEMGVVVLNALNFSSLDVIGLLAQEATTGGPFAGGYLGTALVDLLIVNLVGRCVGGNAARCRGLENLALQQGLGLGDLDIN